MSSDDASLHRVHLNKPSHLEPDETHFYEIGTSVRIDGVTGKILERGYTRKNENEPVYGVIRDDNVETSFTESELEKTDRVEILDEPSDDSPPTPDMEPTP